MKKNKILLLLFLLSQLAVKAQHFNIYPVSKSVTYENAALNRHFVKVSESNIIGSDTIHYFQPKIDSTIIPTAGCLQGTLDTTILGPRYIQLSDGRELLFNKNGDSIFFEPDVTDGQSWIMYTYPNGDFIKATYIFPLYGVIFGDVADSLKRISLTVFTSDNVHIDTSRWWNEQFDMTKDHGLSRFFDFNEFPSEDDTTFFRLAGSDQPDEGIVDVNAIRSFDFSTGYEFHYREEVAPDITSGGDKRISAWKYFVMAKTPSAGAVTYTMERILFDTIYFGATPTATITWDTIDVTYNYSDYAFLDSLEFSLIDHTHFGYSDWNIDSDTYNGIAYKQVYDWYNYDAGTNCLSNPDNITQPEQTYGDGLGLIHYMDSTDASNYYKFDMVYFHVGLLEWGTPYDFSALDENIHDWNANQIQFFPNPSSDFIYCQIPDGIQQCTVTVMSLDGRIILSGNVFTDHGQLSISVDALSSGCYLIRLESENGNYFGKFIRQ